MPEKALEVIQRTPSLFNATTEGGNEIYFNPFTAPSGRIEYFVVGFSPRRDLTEAQAKSLQSQLNRDAELLEVSRPSVSERCTPWITWPGLRVSDLSQAASLLADHLGLW